MKTKTKLFLGHTVWGLAVVVVVSAIVSVCTYSAVLVYFWVR